MLIQSPNFFGIIEDVAAMAEIAHKKGALLVVSIAEACRSASFEPPSEADIVSMEVAVVRRLARLRRTVLRRHRDQGEIHPADARPPGRTRPLDRNGNRGFVLTLSTREQHIRREKATSNICTNQALIALMANIFMTVYGKEGLRELAMQNLAKALTPLSNSAQHAQSCCSSVRRSSTSSSCRRDGGRPRPSTNACSSNKIIGGLPSERSIPSSAMRRYGAVPN